MFDVLSRTTSPYSWGVLEASAGTGKTFSIAHLATRLLIEGDSPLKPREIVLLTFTRQAARELRARLRKTLEETLSMVESGESSIDYVKALFEEGRSEEAALLLKGALLDFHEIEATTIHAFCLKLIRKFALEADLPLHLETEDARLHLQRLILQILEREARLPLVHPKQLELALRSTKHDLVHAIHRAMAEETKPYRPYQECEKEFQQTSIDAQRLQEEYELLGRYYTGVETQAGRRQLELLKRGSLPLLLEEKHWFFEELTPKARLKEAPPEPRYFKEIQEKLLPLVREARDSEALLSEFARRAQEKWEDEEHLLPDDILRLMEKSLMKEPLLQRVRTAYRALIVDEFQDTDPCQWEILKRLFYEGDPRALFLVGDPKQSIYAFRGANLYTYLEAKELLEGARGHLSTNYRSTPALVQALNLLFSWKQGWLHLPATNGALTYVDVAAGRKEEGGESALHFLLMNDEEELFYSIYHEIHGALARGVKPDSFAILVKDRFEGERITSFLERAGVPVRREERTDLRETPAYLMIAALLRYAEEPTEWREKALFLPKEKLTSWALEFREKGASAFVRLVREESFPEKIAADLLDLLAYIAKIPPSGPLFFLERLEEKLAEEKERRCVRGDDAGVRILTIHMSKGLEYDNVIALGLAAPASFEESEQKAELFRYLYVAMTRAKRRLIVPLPLSPRKKLSPIELFFQHLEGKPIDLLEEMKKRASITYAYAEKRDLPPFIWEKSQPPASATLETKILALPRSGLSFSSIKRENPKSTHQVEYAGLPRGKETGRLLHRLIEVILRTKRSPKEVIQVELAGTFLMRWSAEIERMLKSALQATQFEEMLIETEFSFSLQGHPVRGVIDLLGRTRGGLYLIDWKSNWLPAYTPSSMDEEVLRCGYAVQAALYAEAVRRAFPHQELKGASLFFLRGGCLHPVSTDSEILIDALNAIHDD